MSSNLDKRLVEVGYFLARLGIKRAPAQLGANNWKEAYAKFYATFGGEKNEIEFMNSIKNIRDHFDSHLENSRAGWMIEDGSPQQLTTLNQSVFDEFQKYTDDESWRRIRPYAVTSFNAKVATAGAKRAKHQGARFFSSEFSGKQKRMGKASGEVEVMHGYIVDQLKRYVESSHKTSSVFNTQKIDLAREENGVVLEIYEVKTSVETQPVYTAVGQLFMHTAGSSEICKIIVLPDARENADLVECLQMLGIRVIWYVIVGGKCQFETSTEKCPNASSCLTV